MKIDPTSSFLPPPMFGILGAGLGSGFGAGLSSGFRSFWRSFNSFKTSLFISLVALIGLCLAILPSKYIIITIQIYLEECSEKIYFLSACFLIRLAATPFFFLGLMRRLLPPRPLPPDLPPQHPISTIPFLLLQQEPEALDWLAESSSEFVRVLELAAVALQDRAVEPRVAAE